MKSHALDRVSKRAELKELTIIDRTGNEYSLVSKNSTSAYKMRYMTL